jgi:alginate O-acetyltransferase complex protein AlgI
MRPIRSLLLLLIFLACFTGLHYIIPLNRFFPSIYEFVPAELITRLYTQDKPLKKLSIKPVADTAKSVVVDSVSPVDTLYTKVVSPAVFPLQSFLDSLRFSKGQMRIMYYGDSQIEGDRITSYLRQNLRIVHGGTGPGLFLPLMPVMYTKTVWIRSSSNWERYNYLSYKNGEIPHPSLGPFMTLCRYLPNGITTIVPEKAFVKIRPSNMADSASSFYDVLRVFYGNMEGVVNVVVKADGNQVFADTLKKGKGFNELNCRVTGSKEVVIEFEGKVSPDIYGISIESLNGVIVDNIPQRGSAGLEFTMVDSDNLKDAFSKLSPDLFVLQYGLNIVKNVRGDYSYYRKGLVKQLSLLKRISPNTPILVISLTDMAFNAGDSIISYPNIPLIIEAQKLASIETGVVFWNSYHAMGGESSIIKWAGKKPALAQKDYVHLTNPGADTLSKLIANSLFSSPEIDTSRFKKIDKLANEINQLKSVPFVQTSENPEEKSLISTVLSYLFRYNPDEPLIFSTPAFWLFFLFVLAGYSLVYKKLFVRNAYLFLISLFFYYKSGGLFLSLLILVTLIDFTCGLLIHHSRTKFLRRLFIILSILSNIGILAYFKYTGFFVSTINDLFGTDYKVFDMLAALSNSNLGTSFNTSNIILPVGISFFTFQSLSYTIDVYRKKLDPVRNIIDFGFYVSFFPQLVAGPIVRASEFIPQLYKEFHLSKREFSHALFLISKGLIKKIIISDFIATNFIDRVFDAPSIYSGFENLIAVYGYGLQIYCDFSGYTDIAIGLALILGFRLPINFNSPYKARSIDDFWKRWHISLSRWLKDYLYIPLGGNRKGKFRTGINLILTMLLGGLWHGASFRFVIWGALHGIGLVINKIWNSFFGDRYSGGRVGRFFAVFITFQFVSFCWIFFRAPDMESVSMMLRQIFQNFSPGSFMTVIPAYGNVFILILVGYTIHLLPERIKESYRGLFIKIPLIAQLAVSMLVAVMLFQMRTTEVMPFIYFRF